jgi:CO dehydrogenase maturation factor
MGTAACQRTVAVCGKGGVGKTSLSALIVHELLAKGQKVLAIDADPALGLTTAFGFKADRTLNDIRCDLIEASRDGLRDTPASVARMVDYKVFEALEERDTLAFLAIGRPESEGCYCAVNDLLKRVIAALADNFPFVVIDGEAGIEQVNRRVMERVSDLILVSDLSVKGLRVIGDIAAVAKNAIDYHQCGVVVNRVQPDDKPVDILPQGLTLWCTIPEDEVVRRQDIDGASFIGIPRCPAREAVSLLVETRLSRRGERVVRQGARRCR